MPFGADERPGVAKIGAAETRDSVQSTVAGVSACPWNRNNIMHSVNLGSTGWQRGVGCLLLVLVGLSRDNVPAADWPTYQHDQARSGATEESPPADPAEAWVYHAPARPVPAWDEPALWDGWSKIHNLTNRQVFDKAMHVAVVGDAAYFGSSVDDQVYCLELATGERRWTFYTEGPVRLAPTVVGERVYVGSDDGYVYCLQARDGELIWKHRPGPTDRRIPGNGRVISPWAIRTGVVVVGDRAYFGAGVIPSEQVFVGAVNATTGDEIWQTSINDLPAQGYLLASATRLYVVTGRDRPLVFDAATGQRLHQVAGGTGGTYALLTGDTLLYGPDKTGQVTMVGGEQEEDVLASFAGNHMIIANPWSYLHSGNELSALDRTTYVQLYARRKQVANQKAALSKQLKDADANQAEQLKRAVAEIDEQLNHLTQQIAECVKWKTACDCPLSLVLAGNVLLAGGEGKVVAVDATTGQQRWSRAVEGKAYGLAVAQGRLIVSTDEGTIHCFAAADSETRASQPSAEPTPDLELVRLQEYVGPPALSRPAPLEIHGPFAEFIAPGQVRITWDTTEPATTELQFGVNLDRPREFVDEKPKTRHEVLVDDVQREIVFQLRISASFADGRRVETEPYLFDAHFDYLPSRAPDRPAPFPDDEVDRRYAAMAERMIEAADVRRGYVLIVGAVDGRLAYHLARLSELQIVVVEPDPDAVARVRKNLSQAEYYGTRVTVHQRDLKELPYGPYLANLIVSERMLVEGKLPCELHDLYPCLRPAGGTLCLATWDTASLDESTQLNTWRASAPKAETWQTERSEMATTWVHQRGKLPGAGEWTHQYGSADNSSCSQDDRVRGELMVQWWGRPGARPMPDRGNRNPPPVSANGRLYVQGNRTLFGIDAYNGAILWAKQIPTMRRANMPRDGSNMVASDDRLWVSMGPYCVAFDGQTGERVFDREVPDVMQGRAHDWGYVARVGEKLLGSGVRHGSHYSGDKGEWYEGSAERDIARVTSDFLFATQWYGGPPVWLYKQGVVLNSTITIGDRFFFFIESRNQAAQTTASGRMLDEVLQDQVLVALDLNSGKLVWEKPYDFSKCRYVTYVTYGEGTLLVSGTDSESRFHAYAFDAETGEELWQHEAPDKKGHHTGQLAHPTIVNGRVYFNKHTYDLRSGDVLEVEDFNWHGCGVMSASKHTIFSRYEYHGMYDLLTKNRTEFFGLRSGCWLSLIPSGGLLLAPETSAGCSCGHSLQTSIAYVPKWAVLDEQDQPASPPAGN